MLLLITMYGQKAGFSAHVTQLCHLEVPECFLKRVLPHVTDRKDQEAEVFHAVL